MEPTSAGMLQQYMTPLIIVFVLTMVVMFAGWWKIFEKAGEEGWKALIPLYGMFVAIKIAGKPGIWLLWMCIPGPNIIFLFLWTVALGKAFGRSAGFIWGMWLLPAIFLPGLGFGDAEYVGPQA